MSLWVLDTDTLSLWLRGHEAIAAQVARTPPQQLAVTIITVEEILRGGTRKSGVLAKTSNWRGLMRRCNKR